MIEFDIPEEDEEEEEEAVVDAEEIERKAQEEELIQHQKRLQLETEVIKRRLPRPLSIPSFIRTPKDKAQ